MTARIVLAFTAAPAVAAAQISGVIADSIAGRPVPGAVVTAFDSAGRVLRRALADDSGRFSMEGVSQATRLRFVKIGYRPADRRVSSPSRMRVAMERLPSMLEPVRTSDQPRCPRNATRPVAFGLWEQARAALLGTVLARESNGAHVTRLSFHRYMKGASDEIARQTVRRDSGRALRSFDAVRPASEFISDGFAQPEPGGQIRFFGPDAEVLLDDTLTDGYCLELAPRRADRPNQVGLRFRPMARKVGRVDLDGVVWIDTLARTLEDIEYAYLGLERWADGLRPGGRIGFNEVSPAILWIDQWSIRMTGAPIESGRSSRTLVPFNQRRVVIGGAELARARWPDGREWRMPLGSAEVALVTGVGSRIAGVRAFLDSTDYGGVSDSMGRIRLTELLPGPYTVSVFDSTLAQVDTALPARGSFTAQRDSLVRLTATVPTLAEFVTGGCRDQESFEVGSSMLVARIVGPDSIPRALAKWRLEEQRAAAGGGVHRVRPSDPAGIAEGVVGAEGMLFVCRKLAPGSRVVLRAWDAREDPDKDPPTAEAALTISRQVTAVRLVLPRR